MTRAGCDPFPAVSSVRRPGLRTARIGGSGFLFQQHHGFFSRHAGARGLLGVESRTKGFLELCPVRRSQQAQHLGHRKQAFDPRAIRQDDLNLNRRVAARIQDLVRLDLADRRRRHRPAVC